MALEAPVRAAIGELQRLRVRAAAGAGANTSIAIAGLAVADTIVSVLEVAAHVHVDDAAAVSALVDRTSVASIFSAGNLRLTEATVGSQLIVIFFAK